MLFEIDDPFLGAPRYAGVGSQSTPLDVCFKMTKVAEWLKDHGYILRSGHARGADQAFEDGAGSASEIWVPEAGFRGFKGPYLPVLPQAVEIASRVHPNWGACNKFARNAHTRNAHQVLGVDLHSPVDFVLCWTLNGERIGGTATSIRIAEERNIPVYNFGKPGNTNLTLIEFIKQHMR